MRLVVRRTVGIGGATAVALGAVLALGLPASAHTPKIQASCDQATGQAVVSINLTNYSGNTKYGKKNTVKLTEDTGATLLNTTQFGTQYPASQTGAGANDIKNWQSFTVDGTAAHTFTMTVTSIDNIGAGKFTAKSQACPQQTTTAPPTTTTPPPPPPSETTTTAPPATTTETTTPATTTTPVAVAAATTTPGAPGSGSLPFTGVNTALPLGIAGALVVVGGGILFYLRFNARRRKA